MTAVLEQLHGLALKASPYKRVFAALGLVFLLLTLLALLSDSPRSSLWLQAGVIGALWSGLLYAFVDLFREIPPPPGQRQGLLRRFKLKVKRSFYVLMSALVVLTTLFLLSISIRLLSI